MCRVPQVNRNGKEDDNDPIKPVFVSEFPKVVCDEQATSLQRRVSCKNYYCIFQFSELITPCLVG